MAAIFKKAATISTERTIFQLKNVGYKVKGPNLAQRMVTTYYLNVVMGPGKNLCFSNMAVIVKMAETISTKTPEFWPKILGMRYEHPVLHRGPLLPID